MAEGFDFDGHTVADGARTQRPSLRGAPADYDELIEIGRGGMGTIYSARHAPTNRRVALKVMTDRERASTYEVQKFLNEAQVTAQLEHPNVVPVYDISQDGSQLFYAMKHVRGQTLHELLHGPGALPLAGALRCLAQACQGVAYAHSRDVIHRDLKPDNIMVGAFGEVLVMDWGLARVGRGVDVVRDAFEHSRLREPTQHTQLGTVMGTPSYMPPEQANGEIGRIGPASDVFALGAILYEILTGTPPYHGASSVELIGMAARCQVEPPEVRAGRPVDARLATLAMQAMSADPGARPTAAAFADGLETPPTRRRGPSVLVAGLVIVSLVAGWAAGRRQGTPVARGAPAAPAPSRPQTVRALAAELSTGGVDAARRLLAERGGDTALLARALGLLDASAFAELLPAADGWPALRAAAVRVAAGRRDALQGQALALMERREWRRAAYCLAAIERPDLQSPPFDALAELLLAVAWEPRFTALCEDVGQAMRSRDLTRVKELASRWELFHRQMNEQRHHDAVVRASAFLALAPSYHSKRLTALHNRAMALVILGRLDEAARDIRLLREDPTWRAGHLVPNLLATLHRARGDYEQALAYHELCIRRLDSLGSERRGEGAGCMKNRFLTQLIVRDRASVDRFVEHATPLWPRSIPFFRLARAYVRDDDGALVAALEAAPGRVLRSGDQGDQAFEVLAKALAERLPEHPLPYLEQAWQALQRRQLEAARRYIEAARARASGRFGLAIKLAEVRLDELRR